MRYTLTQAAKIAGGRLVGEPNETPISEWAYDSRLISHTDGVCFLGLRSNNRTGAQYVGTLLERDVKLFCISETDFYELNLKEQAGYYWVVQHVLEAIQKLARHRRNAFGGRVIGITGSNGKTIVKEWLYTLLGGADAQVYRSPASHNSQLGVALSVLGIPAFAKTALIEAGISQRGEMAKLASIIKPDLGIFTMLGDAHAAGFVTKREKFAEKWLLFAQTSEVILPQRLLEKYRDVIEAKPQNTALCTWTTDGSTAASADYYLNPGNGQLTRKGSAVVTTIDLPFRDAPSVHNFTICLVAAINCGIEPAALSKAAIKLSAPQMRLSVSEGLQGLRIVDDSYTSDLTGLYAALDFFSQQARPYHARHAILGLHAAMSEKQSKQLAAKLSALNLTTLIIVGEHLSTLQLPAPTLVLAAKNGEEALALIRKQSLLQASVLVKAPRQFELNKVVEALRAKRHEVRLEISLSALSNNIAAFRDRLRPDTKICVMVKAQAYGSGGAEVAEFFAQRGVDYLAVAYLDEGIELRRGGCSLPIIVSNTDPGQLADLLSYKLEPEVTTLQQLETFASADALGIHLKIDTGMHRLGFDPNAAAYSAMLDLLPTLKAKVISVFSHLSASGYEEADVFSRKQNQLLERAGAAIVARLGYKPMLHLANSAAAWRMPELQHDMVRLGIGIYGVGLEKYSDARLEAAHYLVAQIIQIRHVPAGDVVGYGLGGKADHDRTIGVINIGYADGLRREAGNGRYGLYVNDCYAPTVGSVCMDFTMIDLTNCPQARQGDEVEIFGKRQSVQALADCYDTIAYEVFTGIGQRVRRLYFS